MHECFSWTRCGPGGERLPRAFLHPSQWNFLEEAGSSVERDSRCTTGCPWQKKMSQCPAELDRGHTQVRETSEQRDPAGNLWKSQESALKRKNQCGPLANTRDHDVPSQAHTAWSTHHSLPCLQPPRFITGPHDQVREDMSKELGNSRQPKNCASCRTQASSLKQFKSEKGSIGNSKFGSEFWSSHETMYTIYWLQPVFMAYNNSI